MNEKRNPDEVKGKTDLEPARRYGEKAKNHAETGDPEGEAEQARRDLEGPEGEELRKAEQAGKAQTAEEDPEIEGVSDKLRDKDRPL